MPSDLDLSWIQTGRELEVEAVDGGRASNEFTLAPSNITVEEEQPVNDRSVDDVEETEQRLGLLKKYVPYARQAFAERGLTYPFCVSDSSDSLDILPGAEMRSLAAKTARLGRLISTAGKASKEFEERAFKALHTFLGGSGVCVGASRHDRTGPARAVQGFRKWLHPHERGDHHDAYPPNGDLGADGFIILGRPWVGPLVYYQSKNTPLILSEFPDEFGRLGGIVRAWFGRTFQFQRPVLKVLASNTLLTIAAREQVHETQGAASVMIIDAVDILGSENNQPASAECLVL